MEFGFGNFCIPKFIRTRNISTLELFLSSFPEENSENIIA